MRLGILTSSRADFGIYSPLIHHVIGQPDFDLEIIAFGTHLSQKHSHTIDEITSTFDVKIHKVEGMPESDRPAAIALGFAKVLENFSKFWENNSFDWVLALGDRFEMCAAVQAGIPFGLKFGHLHGGETTLGAIDNIYRHQISLASDLHFTAAESFKERVIQLKGSAEGIYAVGSLSLENLDSEEFPSWKEVSGKFNLPEEDFVLVTLHPETIKPEQNGAYGKIFGEALEQLSRQFNIIITLPNADTYGSLIRAEFEKLKKRVPESVFLVESFGRKNYFGAMKAAKFLCGNSSSGIIEAASVGKYVVNIGHRQGGRLQSGNVKNVPFDREAILEECKNVISLGDYKGPNLYYKEGTAGAITNLLRNA